MEQFNMASFGAPMQAMQQQNALRQQQTAQAQQYNALAEYGGPTRGAANALGGQQYEPSSSSEAEIYEGLIKRGMPPHIAKGFVLNMKDESGLNPGINEISPLVPGSRGGFGLYQLTGPRRRQYESFAQERGAALSDTDAQLDFLMRELNGSERSAADAIYSTQNTGDAAAAIVTKFLRPSEEHRNRRVQKYQRYTG